MIKKIGKWVGVVVGVLLVLVLAGLGVVYAMSSSSLYQSFDVKVAEVDVPEDEESIEWGKHIVETRGCADCHGEDYGGSVLMDNAPMGKIAGANLTSGEGGIGDKYSDEDWVRAIRHGIGPKGEPLIFMPSHEYNILDNNDLGAAIAYLKSVPPVDRKMEDPSPGPMARVLYLSGSLPMLVPPELIDHDKERQPAPERAATAEYGEYIAEGCRGCHGDGFSGGKIPGMPPDFPPAKNLTPHDSGIKDWSKDDWFKTLRTGETPSGKEMNKKHMPWHMTKKMTDQELTALWKFFNSLEPTKEGNR